MVSVAAVGAVVLVSSGVSSGCSSKKQTEYVAGVSTQVQVPRDLKTIVVSVAVGGVVQFCQAYSVYNGKVQLPRSLGSIKDQGSSGVDPLTVTIAGYSDELTDNSPNKQINDCLDFQGQVAAGGARVLRRSRQPYITDRVLFLPMPLKYACWDKDCGGNDTCKGGACVPSEIDPAKLPEFSPELVDGTGGGCFHASDCFGAAQPAAVVNPADCTYALPNTPSAPPVQMGLPPNPVGPPPGQPWQGLNVEVTFDGGAVVEVLDKDTDNHEGFSFPDPSKPQQFRLAPGLCDMVRGLDGSGNPTLHRITSIRASGTCRPKTIFEPICDTDQLKAMGADPNGVSANATVKDTCAPIELKPPKAVLMIVADATQSSHAFYANLASGLATISLADPAFEKTDIGLVLFPESGCTTPSTMPATVAPQPARAVESAIKTAFDTAAMNLQPVTPTGLDGALRDTYALLGTGKYTSYYRRAVIVIGNHGFRETTCTGTLPDQLAATARTTQAIDTYVVELAGASPPSPSVDPLDPSGAALAAAGGKGEYDARTGNAAAGQQAVRAVVNDLTTCVYDTPDGKPQDPSFVLSYADPLTSQAFPIKYDQACMNGTAGNGWGNDPATPGRVRLCGAACTSFQGVLQGAAAYANQYGQPALAVPMFVSTALCAPRGGP
jgi:hypothetical protein